MSIGCNLSVMFGGSLQTLSSSYVEMVAVCQ